MQSDAASVEAYLAELPGDGGQAVEAGRRVILEHPPEGSLAAYDRSRHKPTP